jgi:murein lipoprotein
MTMIARTVLTLSALFMLSLTGCATQSQADQQTKQLIEMNTTLKQLQTAQQVSIALQSKQVALQAQSNAQAVQHQAGSR